MLLLLLVLATTASALAPKADQLTADYSFEEYCHDHGKSYSTLQERKARADIFARNLKKILEHNADPTNTWKAGVNRFTDQKHEEFQRLNGVTPYIHIEVAARKQADAEFEEMPLLGQLPTSVDWRTAQPPILTPVKDQGGCGSCWAFGTTEAIESYWAMKTGNLQELSEQFILDCTPNPQDCGGTGGCGGATASLAVNTVVQKGGQPSEWTYSYSSYGGGSSTCNSGRQPIATLTGLNHLPSNTNAATVMNYVANVGPLILNVDASTWHSYESGVLRQGNSGCPINATIDHVVQLVGYGHDAATNLDYWLVRNSWSPQWGEHGYIRLSRETGCGTDNSPGEGNICTGGPSTVPVCGTCGIFYSISYPKVSA